MQDAEDKLHSHDTRLAKLEVHYDNIVLINERLVDEMSNIKNELKELVLQITTVTSTMSIHTGLAEKCNQLQQNMKLLENDLNNYINEFNQCKKSLQEVTQICNTSDKNYLLISTPLKWIISIIGLAMATGVGTYIGAHL